ncbi:MAG: threonine synthase, partial [Jeotgalicoccus sp.]|nr:threonine synthase [Jeotgalicoccus sp.]
SAYKLVASTEGVFCEPGSAASLAGVIKAVENGSIKKGSTVVTVLTGNGLKDPDTAMEVALDQPKKLPLDEEIIVEYIESLEQ